MEDQEETGFLVDAPEAEELAKPPAKPVKGAGKAKAQRGGGSRRLLLLLLLLVVAAAGAYYYLGLEESAPPPAETGRVAVPPKPAQPAPIASPSPSQKEAAAAAEATPAPAAAAKSASVPVTPAAAASDRKAAAESSGPTAPAAAPASPPATGKGAYSLVAGAFLLPENLSMAEMTVRRLGYEPHRRAVTRQVPMTRLQIGVYPPEEAEAKMAELAPLVPDIFSLPAGEMTALYAASYFDLDEARLEAGRLYYSQGIEVTEVPVKLPKKLTLLSFGRFHDLDSARAAAAKAEQAGLSTQVVGKGAE